jgi:hypothetical protein
MDGGVIGSWHVTNGLSSATTYEAKGGSSEVSKSHVALTLAYGAIMAGTQRQFITAADLMS